MTDSNTLNGQLTASVEFTNEEVLKHTEAMALGSLYQSVAHAISLGALNAASAQQQSNVTAQAVITMGASTLYSIDTATDSVFVKSQKILGL
jgi:predicted lipoprotein with Yx(FWY)xxD motif